MSVALQHPENTMFTCFITHFWTQQCMKCIARSVQVHISQFSPDKKGFMNKTLKSTSRPHFIETKQKVVSWTALSGGWNDLIRAKHTVCYRHLAYFHSTLRNKPPPLALRTILLVQSQRPQETCQRRRLHWLKPRSQTDPGSTDANVGGTFFFSCLFFLSFNWCF